MNFWRRWMGQCMMVSVRDDGRIRVQVDDLLAPWELRDVAAMLQMTADSADNTLRRRQEQTEDAVR